MEVGETGETTLSPRMHSEDELLDVEDANVRIRHCPQCEHNRHSAPRLPIEVLHDDVARLIPHIRGNQLLLYSISALFGLPSAGMAFLDCSLEAPFKRPRSPLQR